MALNNVGTFTRKSDTEDADIQQTIKNFEAESWKSWPNEAGFLGLDEHRGPLDLKVRGYIPPWAAGSLYRTGPGQSCVENTSRGTHYVSHWFDGLAHTHKFDIEAPSAGLGKDASATIKYSSCRNSKSAEEGIKKNGWRASYTFAQKSDPCVGMFAKMMVTFRPDALNNNVVVQRNMPGLHAANPTNTEAGHRTGTKNAFVFTDSSKVQEIHPDTMEPVRDGTLKDLHPELSGPMSCAHPQRDPQTGDLFNFNLILGLRVVYKMYKVSATTGETEILASISGPDVAPAYIHSFFLTKNYAVLCIPCTQFAWNGMRIPWEGNLVDSILPFDQSRRTQWIVVDRHHGTGIVARFSTPASFFFHSVNAFEEQTKVDGDTHTDIFFDTVSYPNWDVIKSFYNDVILDRNGSAKEHWLDNDGYKTCRTSLNRFRFRLPYPQETETPSSSPSSIDDSAELVFSIPAPHCGELPTINPAYSTRRHRYVYATGSRGLSTLIDCIVKTDVSTRQALIWGAPKGHSPGEAIFVGKPNATDEDDGVLMAVVLDGTAQRSYLLVLDAKSMRELGRAEAEFAIGMGFHGTHAPELSAVKA